MKLARFSNNGSPELGLVDGNGIISLSRALPDFTGGMAELIAQWSSLAATVQGLRDMPRIPLAEVRLLAPIPRPGKILAIGLNYADHIAESGLATPQHQVWFCKQPTAVAGPFDPVEIPQVSDKVDYEVELVAVIGKAGRHISKTAAAAHVFGYCVGNDVSVRDWQMTTPQWMLGKSFDTHSPFGPWITTADDIGDPHRLGIRCLVNGDMRQNSNTRHLIFTVWDQIVHLSQAMTLEPGDLIFTGTPGGVGWAMDPRRALQAGDKVRCEIDALGAIENTFALEGSPP